MPPSARQPRPPQVSVSRGSAAILLLILSLLAACSPGPEPLSPLGADAVILAFGDSLTAGTGADAGASFPAALEQLTGRRVINAGHPGERSAEGLARLPTLLDEHRPDLLILTHGGNDLLRRMDTDQTRDNVAEMVRLARSQGVDVLLVAVPAPTLLRLRSEPIYAGIADEFRIPLEDGALAHILSRDALKADPIHPNAAGYRVLAERIHELLERSGAL
ncbi:lipolytic enzyme, G-D-S-L family [Thioalkalivibrio nitratireducens DSM 14787]|uniref:Lipolytic enzyme, G-D-S-L family n=1 Tax=Thioalkalivibrio nitratireducens (strain DSM 14787 / UNIQEM 213 / ALEN2) TaxID=1255043 RepID=L0DZM5_THIND|nr:arylesterase [Thioalkalivibrio nitratireducens]AGA34442.1 lipolytic enzyme, G-D-S-L family [Thioalkalivibrio nitratireducens DSM 14787]